MSKTYEVSEADLRLWRDLLKINRDVFGSFDALFIRKEIETYLNTVKEATDEVR